MLKVLLKVYRKEFTTHPGDINALQRHTQGM